MTAFNAGDRVSWPTRFGWHVGLVRDRRPCQVEVRDEIGRTHMVDSLSLTLLDLDTGRLIDRDIRGCCARIPGEHVRREVA